MALAPGTYAFGPDQGSTLTVHTRKGGAASKAGHDLTIEVTAWHATLTVADDAAASALELTADADSLQVREGHGGMMPLGHAETASIQQSMREEVLKGTPIAYRSTSIAPDGDGGLRVDGELELNGRRAPVGFALEIAGGRLRGAATVTQTAFGLKPYSALFGTLKVLDDVRVEVDAALPQGDADG
jgi:polyisoprenoid-binding protein YceI